MTDVNLAPHSRDPHRQALHTLDELAKQIPASTVLAMRRRHDGALFVVTEIAARNIEDRCNPIFITTSIVAFADLAGSITIRAQLGPAPAWLTDRIEHTVALPSCDSTADIAIVRNGLLAEAWARAANPTPRNLYSLMVLLCGLSDGLDLTSLA